MKDSTVGVNVVISMQRPGERPHARLPTVCLRYGRTRNAKAYIHGVAPRVTPVFARGSVRCRRAAAPGSRYEGLQWCLMALLSL